MRGPAHKRNLADQNSNIPKARNSTLAMFEVQPTEVDFVPESN